MCCIAPIRQEGPSAAAICDEDKISRGPIGLAYSQPGQPDCLRLHMTGLIALSYLEYLLSSVS
jgi:hypothetical protein